MGRPPDARASLRPGEGHRPTDGAFIERTLASAFESSAARHADRPAVRVGRTELRYRDLDRAADRVAHALAAAGVRAAEPVGVMAGQGVELVVAILGVLKAGAAYVPLDPAHPPARSAEVLGAVEARRLVTDPGSRRLAASLVADPIVATADADGADGPPDRDDDPDALAYVYFTSGSTGRPKGVMDSHRHVLDNIRRYTDTLAIGSGDRLSLVQTIAFSGAVSSLFGALVNGACVHPFDVRASGVAALRDRVVAERLTMFHAVPVLFRALTDDRRPFPDLRVVRLEGDAASWSDVERGHRSLTRGAVLVNGLGATETGLVRQFFTDHDTEVGAGSLPLGYPVPGVEVRVEDDEIVVVGSRLALGYWGDPARTAAAFTDLGDGRRAYRTGDLGRLEADGRLIGLGRRDFAEKIRGETVDLGAVEARLRAIPGVADAVAITRRDGAATPRLVGYVVPPEGADPPDPARLRRMLAEVLPASAVPSAVVAIPAVPLDPSGKVDRAALPAPGRGRPPLAVAYAPPGTPLEHELVRVWESLLDVRPIGVHDEFFDLGGDSLDAARLVSELEGMAPPAVADDIVLTASTIADLAGRLAGGGRAVPAWHAIHANPGDPGFYARVARAADGAIALRTIAPSPDPARRLTVEALAAQAVAMIRERSPVGPYRLLGFCFNAPVALEAARRLQGDGHDVVALALLGISPLELPGLIDIGAVRPSGRSRRFRQRARTHLEEIRSRGPDGAVAYVSERLRARLERTVGDVRRVPDPQRSRAAAVRDHRARPFDGRVLVVLGRGSAALYTADPRRAWRRLGREVDIVVLAGDDHAMLVEPEASRLARVLVAAATDTRGLSASAALAAPAAPTDPAVAGPAVGRVP